MLYRAVSEFRFRFELEVDLAYTTTAQVNYSVVVPYGPTPAAHAAEITSPRFLSEAFQSVGVTLGGALNTSLELLSHRPPAPPPRCSENEYVLDVTCEACPFEISVRKTCLAQMLFVCKHAWRRCSSSAREAVAQSK